MFKRQLASCQEGDEEVLRRVRLCQGFGSAEGLEDVTSANFDLEFAPEFLALNSPVTGEVSLAEWSEMQDNESIEEREENSKCTVGGKDKVSSSLPRSVRVLFLRSLEPEATLGIDEEMDTVHSVWDAWKRKDAEAIDKCLALACEEILQNSSNPSRHHFLSLAYISRKMPEAFGFSKTYKILLKLLHTGTSKSPMNRANLLPVFASKLLYRGFVGESEWPIEFIQAYLRDIVGPCAWIEHDSCKDFVGVLATAFQDSKMIPGCRYSNDEMRKMVRGEYFTTLDEVLKVDTTREDPRVLMKLLLVGIEYEEARLIASSMLEGWINDPVHMDTAKTLLDCVVQKTCSMRKSDISTVGNLFLLKIKNQHNNIYSEMVTQLVCKRREYAIVALKTLVLVELSEKDMLNLKRMSTILRVISVTSSSENELALILQELAANDNTRIKLKEFVCRVIKNIGDDINIKDLCHTLLKPWVAMANQELSLKVAWLTEMAELVTALLLQSTGAFSTDENIMSILSFPETGTFSDSEDGNIISHSEKEKIVALEKFSLDLSMFQLEAMAWCTDVVSVYAPNMNEDQFANILKQVLFLGNHQAYFPQGDLVGEIECNALHLLGACTRASEEILARVILLGISDVYPLSMGGALSIIESLVWRAGAFHKQFRGSLHAESKQLPQAVIKLASFSFPGIPKQYFSHIVYKDKYWRACLVLLLLAVYNPGTIGQYVWENNSTVRDMMEVVVTGSWNSSLSYDETAGKTSINDLESEAMNCDAKAEESLSSILLNSRNANTTTSGDIILDTTMWKGNVTLLNELGTLWRLPESIIEELEQADKIYQLGHGLRKCRSPDFFAEITGLQTLQKAWRWLRMILPQEPELVSVLPLLWQCELIYMQEGLTACGGGHFADTRQLYLILCKVVSDKAREKEAKVVIHYFSCKLGDKCNLIRSQARCCLARLFNTLFSFLEAVPLHGESSRNHSITVETFFESCNSAREEKLISITKTFSVTDDYELGWLEGIEALPSSILSSLLPAIRTAVQVETSFELVSSYLKFLQKHSPPLPSHLSAACVIATLFVQRKEFAASLLLREKEYNLYMICPSYSVVGQHTCMAEFILNSLCEALILGTSGPLNDEDVASIESPLVTLVVPQNAKQDTRGLLCITLHKIVLDAALFVLSLCSNREINDKCKNSTVERMIQILLPNVAGKMGVASLESRTGQKLPLLSEEQAMAFAQSSDDRIALAGYNALSINGTLWLCQSLGIPPSTVDYILDVLNSTAGVRLHELLKPMKTKEHQALILLACLQTLSMFTNKSFPNLSQILSHLSSASFSAMTSCLFQKSVQLASSIIGRNEENYVWLSTTDIINSTVGQMANSYLSYDLGLLKGVSCLILAHAELRKCIQREICWDNELSLLHTMGTSLRKFKAFQDHKLSWVHLSFLLLPCLAVLQCSIHSTLENITSLGRMPHSEWEFQGECQRLLQSLLSQMEMELASIFDGNNVATNHKTISVIHAKFIMAELGNLYAKTDTKPHSLSEKSLFKTLHVNFQESCSLIDSDYLALLGVEGSLRTFLQLKFQKLSSECCFDYAPDIFISEILQFMLKISMRGSNFLKYIGNLEEDDTLGNKGYIMFSGCCALFTRFLNLIDLNTSSNVCTYFEILRDKETVASLQGPTHSLTQLFLENIAHESSWLVIIKVMKSMLETYFGMVNPPISVLNKEERSEPPTTYLLSTFNLEKKADLVSILEFLHTCSHHTQTVLVNWLSDRTEFQVTGKNIEASLITRLSASCLFMCKYPCQGNASSYKIVEEDLISLAISLLVTSASASGNNFCVTIENLLSLDLDGACPLTMKKSSDSAIHDIVSSIVKELLWTIYFSFPLSVCGIPRADVFLKNNTLDGFNILHGSNYLFCRSGQAFPLFKILQNSLRLVCEGTEKESNTAYGFCHHLAKKHPTLILPHMSTLAALLKEKIPGIKKGEGHGCSFGHALYLVAGLLDALRPHIFDLYNSNPFPHDAMYSGLIESESCRFEEPIKDVYERQNFYRGSLEVILDIYFEILNNIDAVNLAQYLKVVLRLTDFLCHCVAAGKHCLDIVHRHQKLIQTTTQKFPKIKKLGFLLSLLENHDLSVHSARTDADELLKGQSDIDDSQFGPPMLPIDVVLKVQSQLQRFLALQTDSSDGYSLTSEECQQRNLKNTKLEDEINLLSILNDVEKASARVPTLLTSLEEFMIQLMKVENKDIQACIYQLLERLLLHCPSEDTSERVIKALLHNLKSADISLAKMAAQQAVKFFYHCPELQETVLLELFLSRGFAEEDLQQLLHDLLLIVS